MKALATGLLLLYCGGVFAACYEDVDKFKGNELRWCGAWGTGGKMLGGLNGIDPIPYLSKSEGKTSLFIRLVLDQSNFLFINAGDELVFILNTGERVTLKAKFDGIRDVKSDSVQGVHTNEYADYAITLNQFKALSDAEYIDFAAYTSKGRVERQLKKAQLKIYREFLENVVAAHAADVQ